MKKEILYQNIVLTFILVFIMLVTIIMISQLEKECEEQSIINTYIVSENEVPLTSESVFNELGKYNFEYPEIVMAQFILESGYFESQLTETHNNFMGMKIPYKRETVGLALKGETYNYYVKWQDCVEDRWLFEKEYLLGRTKEEYLQYLGRNYAEDKEYINKINLISKQWK